MVRWVGNFQSGAVFSDCRKYRYRLWRCWDPDLPRACFILLNPSTADAINNDATVERQKRRVISWREDGLEFGSIEVVNAFALRYKNPVSLYLPGVDPVGPDNDEAIRIAADVAIKSFGLIVCGWGTHARNIGRRHDELLELLSPELLSPAKTLYALKLNLDGTPQHPLYLPYGLLPRRWYDGKLCEEE